MILVAPDSFKGTLTSSEVAMAVADGLREAGVEAIDLCPVADGGEGTLSALAMAWPLELRRLTVNDPLGRPVAAEFGFVPGQGRRGAVAVIEMAAASGLALVGSAERDAMAASSFGTGELIAAAAAAGAGEIYVGLGGSATTDGGAGAVEAIRAAGGLEGVRLAVLCDVRTPFEDAAKVFAPQKGASPAQVRELRRRLDRLAGRLSRDPRGRPLTGAAGGLSGALWAEFGANLAPGAAFVLNAIGFDRRATGARAVITGEGRLDRQSLAGKAVSEVATRARQSGVPCYAVVGGNELDAFGQRILDLMEVLEAGNRRELRQAGMGLAGRLTAERPRDARRGGG